MNEWMNTQNWYSTLSWCHVHSSFTITPLQCLQFLNLNRQGFKSSKAPTSGNKNYKYSAKPCEKENNAAKSMVWPVTSITFKYEAWYKILHLWLSSLKQSVEQGPIYFSKTDTVETFEWLFRRQEIQYFSINGLLQMVWGLLTNYKNGI